MDCLHGPDYKGTEPRLLDNNPRGGRRGSRLVKALLGILTLLFLILLAVVIWLGVEYHKCRKDIDDLKLSFQSMSDQSYSTVSVPSSSNSSSITPKYPAVYLSKNATTSPGYAYAGQLFRYCLLKPKIDILGIS